MMKNCCLRSIVTLLLLLLLLQRRLVLSVGNDDIDIDSQLIYACGEGNLIKAKQLVQAGADVNTANSEGETPLHVAGIKGNKGVIQFLVSSGANVNARATGEKSLRLAPLHWCLWHGHRDCIQILLDANADANTIVYNEQGGKMTALDIAELLGLDDIISLLKEHGAKPYSQYLIKSSREEKVDL